jgi:hypothetical protein
VLLGEGSFDAHLAATQQKSAMRLKNPSRILIALRPSG